MEETTLYIPPATAVQGSGPLSISSVTTRWSARQEEDKPVWEKAAACEITALCWIQRWGDTQVLPTNQKLWEQGMASAAFPVQHLARGDQAPLKPTGVLVVL